ncbi:YxlC family protein [Bacillus sp. B15-48]|uniref:YxlC family protein n=1 Tax=Bacillus sp. B15-48 TaxID=1548601 RepID=UPI00193F6354|nr:YxlC family protein [Bacillus sp. B15-48]MBM4765184.1 hypothetical protein [Bacillus sp. B15-48]
MKQDDREQIQKLHQDWEQIDELAAHSSTSVINIKEQLADYRAMEKKRFYKELAIFLFTAVFVLTVFALSIVQVPRVFIYIQVGATFLAPIVLFLLFKRKKQEGETL